MLSSKTVRPTRKQALTAIGKHFHAYDCRTRVQEGTWTKETLAAKLQEANKEWTVAKNKTAISGTLADLRKKQLKWTVSENDKGVINVKEKQAQKTVS